MAEPGASKNAMQEFRERFAAVLENIKGPCEISFPVEVTAIATHALPRSAPEDAGRWCSIRPVNDPKTYLGIYLGDLILEVDHFYHVGSKVLTIAPRTNPAIFVPDLNRIVWGVESWWGLIETPEQLRQISDADIQNVWYVRALKELAGPKTPGAGS